MIAEYALRRVDSPMGISEYELSKSLPQKFESILPTTEEIEAELSQFTNEDRTLVKGKDDEPAPRLCCINSCEYKKQTF